MLDNAAGLVGQVKSVNQIDNINGLKFDGYEVILETVRPSGVADTAVVIVPDTAPLEILNNRVMVYGKMQTTKNFETGKVLVYILAEHIGSCPKGEEQNEVQLSGILGRGITYRTTPRGKRITDIMVEVPNELRQSLCYIPCICWNEEADEVKDWKEGTAVELSGRLQSRQYSKTIDLYANDKVVETVTEQHTCYEVSVNNITKKES
jgi:primosomal replication protein N